MEDRFPKINEIEIYIDELRNWIGSGSANIIPTVPKSKDKSESGFNEFESDLKKVDFLAFITFGNYHYFISRILFMNYDTGYSYFAGQQCIENYLKAFIKWKEQIPPTIHDLLKLLEKCNTIASIEERKFLSDKIYTIAYKYNPFDEIPRYPVTHNKWYGQATLFPDDIYILDYFVLKMLDLFGLEKNKQELRDGHFLNSFLIKEHSPDFMNKFFEGNIICQTL
jgi:HEPN domain